MIRRAGVFLFAGSDRPPEVASSDHGGSVVLQVPTTLAAGSAEQFSHPWNWQAHLWVLPQRKIQRCLVRQSYSVDISSSLDEDLEYLFVIVVFSGFMQRRPSVLHAMIDICSMIDQK